MKGYLEFYKNVVCIHPGSGEFKKNTVFDIYIYEKKNSEKAYEICIWGWGTIDNIVSSLALSELINRIKNYFAEKGFKLMAEEIY